MSQLIVYNWTPWSTYVQVNGLQNTTWSPLKPSTSGFGYYPYSGQIPRDLSLDHGTANVWGKTNRLTIRWDEVTEELSFPQIEDPQDAMTDVDLLLWVFSDRVVFSQRNSFLKEVYPTG